MVVTNGVQRAIQYDHAIRESLTERESRYQAILAFSGDHDYGGRKVSEASLNGFSANNTAERFREDPYRFLVCADKFQTGYDEPLLHTMYVDKALSGIKAVQTLSRLNRAHPHKHDVFVLDFFNDADTIADSFADYYLLPHHDPVQGDRPEPAARPSKRPGRLPGLLAGAGLPIRAALSGWRRPPPTGPHPRSVRGDLFS